MNRRPQWVIIDSVSVFYGLVFLVIAVCVLFIGTNTFRCTCEGVRKRGEGEGEREMLILDIVQLGE